METEHKRNWEEYREAELAHAKRVASQLGFSLDERQVHIGGERYLMTQKRDVGGGGLKLVLLGKRGGGKRVVIKFSSEQEGMREIETEHNARHLISNLDFAYHAFAAPEELLYKKSTEYAIAISAYIEQTSIFLSRSKEEQFMLALRSFKTQEGVHATTYAHAKKIRGMLGMINAEDYLHSFDGFTKDTLSVGNTDATLSGALQKAGRFLEENKTTIEQYCDFLTHSDFVPHNLRIVDNQIYLLDYASIHFGNKHESWARFLNFMTLYNPSLEQMLLQYVKDNRSPEEYLSLRLMRVYKLGFLLSFYAGQLGKASGDLEVLAKERIAFWAQALLAVIEDEPLQPEIIRKYQEKRDTLRSTEEKERQKELH